MSSPQLTNIFQRGRYLAEDTCLDTFLMTIQAGTTAFPWEDALIPRDRTPPRDPAAKLFFTALLEGIFPPGCMVHGEMHGICSSTHL